MPQPGRKPSAKLPEDDKQTVLTRVYLEAGDVRWLRQYAQANEINVSAAVRKAVKQFRNRTRGGSK